MRTLRAWIVRVIAFVRPGRGEREFAEELQSHIDLHVADNLSAGMTPAEARRQALIKLGSAASVSEAYRDRRGLPALESLIQDARHAVRGLRRNPAFALACVITLALGIGVNSAIFSVVHAVLFAPLPYAKSEQLITIWTSHPEIRRPANAMSHDNAIDLERMLTTVSGLGVLQAYITPATIPINGEGVAVNGTRVTADLFDLLGTRPLLGRGLQIGDGTDVIVISHGLWQRVFGGDRAVIGRVLGRGPSSATVVGVMPRGFALPYPSMLQATVSFVASPEVDFWMALAEPKPGAGNRRERLFAAIARVKDGVSIEAARTDVRSAWQQLAQLHPDVNGGWSAHVVPLHQQAVGPVRSAMLLLFGSVGVVLLIACVNVANLMLARGVARQRELCLRAVLGAGRSRLLQQVIVEGLVLSGAGALLGLLFARWATPLLVQLAPAGTPRIAEVTTDGTVVMFTMIIAVICGVAVSAIPALGASRVSVRSAIVEGGRSASDGRRRLRGLLVAAEVALAVVLTIGAGLLGRSFLAVLNVDPGFRPDHLLTMQVNVPARHDTNEKRVAFYQQLFARLEAIPGVISVGGTTRLPMGGTNSTTQVAVEGRVPPDGQWPEADFRRAVHSYFETMNIPVHRGRGFTDADHAAAPPVVVINEAFARRMFGDEDPIGRRLRLGASSPVREATIVGIVGDLRHQRLDVAPVPEVYISYLQGPPVAPLVVFRTADNPANAAASIRAALREVDSTIVPSNVRTMDELRTASVADRVFLMALIIAFGVLALALAAVGVYGVLTLVVAERKREMSIRLALGASPQGLVALVISHAMTLTVGGVVAGITIALMLSPLVSSQLYGIGAADPLTIGGVAGVLLGVAVIAAAVPARRVMRADPASTLRCD
jgi:putative ABC transport system permease protein